MDAQLVWKYVFDIRQGKKKRTQFIKNTIQCSYCLCSFEIMK